MKITGARWAEVVEGYYDKFGVNFPTVNLSDKQVKYVFDEARKAIAGKRDAIKSDELYSIENDY